MARRCIRQPQRGAVLLLFMVFMVLGTLTYLVNSVSPAEIELKRQRQTEAALAMAKDALIGYALTYRDRQLDQDTDQDGDNDQAVLGYLPMPDMGETFSRNSDLVPPPRCVGEGCATLNKNSINQAFTYIGRFPWKTLGLPPLRDGYGECLWYAVSASHREPNQDTAIPMNWDTVGQLDLIKVDGAAEGLTGHQRPIAIIVAPGSSLKARPPAASDDVTQCQGNYIPGDYLELTTLGPAPFNTPTSVGGDTSASPKPISIRGKIPTPGNQIANDSGIRLTSDMLFDALRKRKRFRDDINDTLYNLKTCLGRRLYSGASTPPSSLFVGRPPDLVNTCQDKIGSYPCLTTTGNNMTGVDDPHNHDCYSDRKDPRGYATHYQEQFFFIKPSSGSLTVNGNNCDAVVILGNQRNTNQLRTKNGTPSSPHLQPDNYLESPNLDSFLNSEITYSGDEKFSKISEQVRSRDIVACIKAADPSDGLVLSTNTTLSLAPSLITVNTPGQTINLGTPLESALPNSSANYLFGCKWEQFHPMGSGFRSYFKFRINDLGNCSTAACIQEGFAFAIVDGDNNKSDACGGAAQHMGYSGNNSETPFIAQPKIGLEIDPRTSRNAHPSLSNFFFDETVSNTLTNGRNDPSSSASYYRGGHLAITYWGGESPIVISPQPGSCNAPRVTVAGQCALPQEQDDNVHGHVEAANAPPYAISRTGFSPPPVNPNAPRNSSGGFLSPPKSECPTGELCGIFKLDPGRRQVPINQDFHIRLELSRKPSEFSLGTVRVATTENIDISMPGAAIDGIPLIAGDRVLVKNQTQPAQNGIYEWTGESALLVRTTDANQAIGLMGKVIEVKQGVINSLSIWRQSGTVTTLGTDAVNWSPLFAKIVAPSTIDLDNPGTIIDGIRMKSGDRVFVRDAGVYVWNGAGVPMDASSDIFEGSFIQIRQGSEASSWWKLESGIWRRNSTARIATDNDLNLANPTSNSIQGTSLAAGDRILVRAQNDPRQNGIYVWSSIGTALTRSTDATSTPDLAKSFVQVMEGKYSGQAFYQTALTTSGTVGIDPILWSIIDPSPSPDFQAEVWVLPDSTTTADQIAAMKNTTRPMSELYPTFVPHMRDSPRIPYPFRNTRLGFTVGQRTAVTDQNFTISNFDTTWLE